MATCTWLSTEFTVFSHADQWNNVGGVYIFSKLNQQQHWVALYVGETDSFASRLPNHERWQEARQLGATHVHARTVDAAGTRAALQEQLIVACQPPLNVQLK